MKITIPGEFTDLNTYINAERRNRFIGAKIKKEETERVHWRCKELGLKPITVYPLNVDICWYTKNQRKDPDNIAFAVKFLLDGLVSAGVLREDGAKEIYSIRHSFTVDEENPRVEARLYDVDLSV